MADPLLALVRVLASAAGEALVDGPEDRARLTELVRAEMARLGAAALTVGAALAQGLVTGGMLAEADDPRDGWMQIGTEAGVIGWRLHDVDEGWEREWCEDGLRAALLALPCRLVSLAFAEEPPTSRGPL